MRGNDRARHDGEFSLRTATWSDMGSALLVVLAASAILFVTAAAVVGVVVFQQTQASNARAATRASQLAQQGMEYYLAAMKQDPQYWETRPAVQGTGSVEGQEGTWTVSADRAAGTLTAVGHDPLTDLLHVIKAKVRPEIFSDYTIVSGSEARSLVLGDTNAKTRLEISGQARGAIQLADGLARTAQFASLHILADASSSDFSDAENSLPRMFTAASLGNPASPLAYYRDRNDPERNYWGDVSNLAANPDKTLIRTEPQRVGVGVDLSGPSPDAVWVRAVFPPNGGGQGSFQNRATYVVNAAQDPTWNMKATGGQPSLAPINVNYPESRNLVDMKALSTDGNNVIYVGGGYDVYVKGSFSRSLTIVCEGDIYIIGDIKPVSPDSTATIGLVAKHNIYIDDAMPAAANTNGRGIVGARNNDYWQGEVMPQTLTIHAALLSVQGSIQMGTPTGTIDPIKRTGKLEIVGSLAALQGLGGPNFVETAAGKGGFAEVKISHDRNLDNNPPPLFPQIGSGGLKVVSWDEFSTRTEPDPNLSFIPVTVQHTPLPQDSLVTWENVPASGAGSGTKTTLALSVPDDGIGTAIVKVTPPVGDGTIAWEPHYALSSLRSDGTTLPVSSARATKTGTGTEIKIPLPLGDNTAVTYVITYWSVDQNGNPGFVGTNTFVLRGPDTSKPSTTVMVKNVTETDRFGVEVTSDKVLGDGYEGGTVWDSVSMRFTSLDMIVNEDGTTGTVSAAYVKYRVLQDIAGQPTVIQKWTQTVPDKTFLPDIGPWVSGQRFLTFEYYGLDAAGNAEVPKSFRILQHAPDNIAPTSVILTHKHVPSGTDVFISATDDPAGGGIPVIWYKTSRAGDPGWRTDGSNPTTISLTPVASGVETVAISYYAVDRAGNKSPEQVATVDIVRVPVGYSTPPITTSDAAASYTGQAVITLTPFDEYGVKETYYQLDGGPAQTGTVVRVAAPYVGSTPHNLKFWSVNVADIPETAHSVDFTVYPEQTPPVTVATNDSLYGPSGLPVFVKLTARDVESGIKNTFYKIDGGLVVTLTPSDLLPGVDTFSVPVTGEGSHTITFWSLDKAGNTESPKTTSLRIDTTPPTTTAANSGSYAGAAKIALTASDPSGSGVETTYWKVAGGYKQASSTVLLGQGSWTVSYWSVDKAGNAEAAKTFDCVVAEGSDFTPPASYDDIVPAYRRGISAFTLYSWDVQSGVKTMHYILDGAPMPTDLAGVGDPPLGYRIAMPAEGSHRIEYWAEDGAGNIESTHTVKTFTVDTINPVTAFRDSRGVESTTGMNPVYWSDQTFSLVATDGAGSGVGATYYAIDGGPEQLGTSPFVPASTTGAPVLHTIDYWSLDKAGNQEGRRTIRITSQRSDVTPPTTTSDMKPGYKAAATVTLTALDPNGGSGVAHTYYSLDGSRTVTDVMTANITGAGKHTLAYWSVDVAGNSEPTHTVTTSIDITAPTSSSNAMLRVENGSLTYSTGWTPDFTGYAPYTSGTNNVSAVTNASASYTFTGTSVAWYGSKISDHGNARVYIDNVLQTTVDTYGGAHQQKLYEKAGLAPGSHTIKIEVAGTRNPLSSNFYVDVDYLEINAGKWYAGNSGVTLSAVDNADGSGIASILYSLDGAVAVTRTGSPTTVDVSAPGSHMLEYWAADNAGNVESPHKTVSFGIDTTPPVTTSNAQAAYTSGPAVITLTPTDAGSGVKSTYYTVDGGATQWTLPITVTPPLSGTVSHVVKFWSVDNVGNTEAQQTVSFTVAATAGMTFSGVTPPEFATITLRNPTVSVTAKCDRNIIAAKATLNGVTQTLTVSNAPGYWVYSGYWDGDGCSSWYVDTSYYVPADYTVETASFPTSALLNGTYKVAFTFTASSGLQSEKLWEFTVSGPIDKTAPVTTCNAAAYYKTAAAINLSAVDEVGGMGLAAICYKLDGGAVTTVTTSPTTVNVSAAGAHTLEYWSVDQGNNTEVHRTASFNVDYAAPVTSSNATTTVYKGNATISLVATDGASGSGVAATYYKIDTGTQQTGTSVVVPAPVTGAPVAHTVYFWSVDKAGNIEVTKSAAISVRPADDVPPNTASDAKSVYPFQSTISLVASDNVGGSGLAATYYTLDTGAQQTGTSIGTGGAGGHTLTFWSVDVAGNVETAKVATYTVSKYDSTPPVSGTDAGTSYVESATIKVWSADEVGGSGVKYLYYRLDNAAQVTGVLPTTTITVQGPPAGTASHTITYWAVDNVGNTEVAKTATFGIAAKEFPMVFTAMTPAELALVTIRDFSVSVNGEAGLTNITAVTAKLDGVAKTVTTNYAHTDYPGSGWVPPHDEFYDDGCSSYWYTVPGYWTVPPYTVYDYTNATVSFPVAGAQDGTHTVSFTFTVTGGAQATKTWTFAVKGPDNQAPLTTVVDPRPAWDGTATVTLSAIDQPLNESHAGVAYTYYRLDTGARQGGTGAPATSEPVTTTIVVAPPVYGSATHTIYYWSVDQQLPVNTEAEKSYTFVINAPRDSIPPTTTSDATSTYTGTAKITLTPKDNVGGWGIKGTYYILDNTPKVTGTVITVAPPASWSATHTLTFWSDDLAGNVETTPTTVTFVVWAPPDTTPPVTTSNAVALYTTTAGTISLTANDNAGGWGVDKTYYKLDNGAQQTWASVPIPAGVAGTHTIEFWSVDRAQVPNQEAHKTFSYIVDNVAPVTGSNVATSYVGPALITLTPNDNVGGSGISATYYTVDAGAQQTGTSISIAAPSLGSASHTITYWSVDKANNKETATSKTFTVSAYPDLIAPTSTSNAQTVYAMPGTITLSATDNIGGWGVAATYYILDNGAQQTGTSLGTGGAGPHRLEFWSVDKATPANTETPHKVATYTVTTDTVAPITTSNAGTWYYDPATILLTATDVGWGVQSTYYTVDGGATQTGTTIVVPGPKTGSASHTITFWSVDKAGNPETPHSATFVVSAVPADIVFSGMTPTAGATILSNSAAVSVVGDAVEQVISATATVDGTPVSVNLTQPAGYWVYQGYWDGDGCSSWYVDTSYYVPGDLTIATVSFTAANLPDGLRTVSITYTVASGRVATKTWTFNVSTDKTAPTTGSDVKAVYNGAATIKLTPTDNALGSGVKATYYKVDGGAQQTGTTISVAAPASGSATHTIEYWSVDNASNSETPKSATFVVWRADTIAPTTTSTALPYYRAPSTITLTATDNSGGSGVAHTYYKLDTSAVVEGTLLGTGGEGKHTLEFWSVDVLGNIEAHNSVIYYVDMTAPKTASDAKDAYQGSATEYTGIAVITLTPTDTPTGSGIGTTMFTLDGGAPVVGTSIIISGATIPFDTHTITFWSVDKAGNIESANTKTFTVAPKPDSTPPVTTSDGVTSYSVPGLIQLTAKDTLGWGVLHTYWTLDGGVSHEDSMTVPTGGPGTHTLEFWSVDRANNTELPHKSLTYTVAAADNQPPVTTSNAAGSYKGPATITLTATDNSGILPLTWFRIDDGVDQIGTTILVPAPVAGVVSHVLHFWSVDSFNNKEIEQSKTISVEALPAAMTFSDYLPSGGTTLVRNPKVSVSALADYPITGASGTVDGIAQAFTFEPGVLDNKRATAWLQLSGLANAVHKATVTFTDSTGAQNTATWTFIVDAPLDVTPPVTTVETTSSGGTGYITITATDEGGMGVATTYYRLDGALWQSTTPPVVLTVGAGAHTIECYSVDRQGLFETAHTTLFTVDITPPKTTVVTYADYTGTATITFKPDDGVGGSGVKATYYQLDSGPVLTGTVATVSWWPVISDPATHTLTYWSEDNQGNIEAKKTTAPFLIYAPFDGTPPTTTSDAVASYTTTGVITLTPVDPGGWGVAHTYYKIDAGPQVESTTVPVGAVGTHTLEFWSVDKAENAESPHHTVSYTVSAVVIAAARVVDKTPPTTVSNAVATYPLGTGQINLTATDVGGSGVVHTYYRWDDGPTIESTLIGVSGAGEHHVDFWSVDGAGNQEAPHTVSFTVTVPDVTAPVTTSNAQLSYGGAAQVTLTATDASGVRSTNYRVDGGPAQVGTIVNIAAPVSGTVSHTIEFWSIDNVGNIESASTKTFAVTAVLDPAAPFTASDLTANYIGAARITLTATDNGSGSGVAATYYRLDGGAQTIGTVIEVAAPQTGVQVHTIEYWSVDNAGHIETPHHTSSFTVMASDAPVATLSFMWEPTYGQATLHVENASGVTIASKALSGSGAALDWHVQVPAGATYRMVCDYYYDGAGSSSGSGVATWSGITTAGQEFIWNY